MILSRHSASVAAAGQRQQHGRVAAAQQRRPLSHRSAARAARRHTIAAATPPEAEPEAPVDAASSAPATPQEQAAAIGKGIIENRRLIAVAVAVADVAFLWVALKFGKSWWTANH